MHTLASSLLVRHLLQAQLALAPSAEPGLHFIDVGQGSALLIEARDEVFVLVDSGPAAGAHALLRALSERGVDELALWIHTHHDADHIGGFAPVLAGLDGRPFTADDLVVHRIWDRGLDWPLPQTEAFDLYLSLAGDLREQPLPGAVFEQPGLRIEVLSLDAPSVDAGENDRGLGLCVELEQLRALLPGDASRARVEQAASHCGDVDLLWLAHHGSASASSAALFELADPELVVISAGHDNPYCHPSPLALALATSRPTVILDGAGLRPGGPCPALAEALRPSQHVLGSDAVIDPRLRIWLVGPGQVVEAPF